MAIKRLTPDSANFPYDLLHIASPPKELFALGDLKPLLEMPRLAVIGSRRVSVYGRQITRQLVSEAAGKGTVIVSGLALGVDGVAHQAALEAGGRTIAVLPSGLDKIYPATHHHLARRILEQGGALISEYPAGVLAFKQHFIARNRLVSGISDGVLITEAAAKSGTLHTANFALDQGKTVMAVPGNITSPLSEGTNNLIKAGAVVVTSVQDICNAMELNYNDQPLSDVVGATKEETLILTSLLDGITEANQIMLQTNLTPAVFNQTLTMLEINGKIRPLGAGHWSLN